MTVFKTLKLKEEREIKENATELQKPNREMEVYNSNKKYVWGKKKVLQSFIKFYSANKIDNYN